MSIGEIITNYCKKMGITQRQFAMDCGVSNSYITMLIKGINPRTNKPSNPKIETYDAIARAMHRTIDELFKIMDDAPIYIPKRSMLELLDPNDLQPHKIPLIGSVAGGEPIFDEEIDLMRDGPIKASCAVRLKGDSMEPLFKNGDIIYVKEQPDVNDGQIAIVFVDDESMLKRVYHVKDGLQLLSENPKYKPINATFEEYNSIRILGIPCGFTIIFDSNVKIVFSR